MVGIGFITLLIVLAIATPWIAPYDYGRGALQDANKLPSAAHWLGTDALGRDELTRLMWGARVSLTVAIGAQIIVILIGVTLGLVSGFFGGWLDYIVMRFVEVFTAVPIWRKQSSSTKRSQRGRPNTRRKDPTNTCDSGSAVPITKYSKQTPSVT